MATLAELEEKRLLLEERLAEGDLSAEAALAKVDAAIRSRSKQIQHSQQRLAAVKQAVAKGVPLESVKTAKSRKKSSSKLKPGQRKVLNRFD